MSPIARTAVCRPGFLTACEPKSANHGPSVPTPTSATTTADDASDPREDTGTPVHTEDTGAPSEPEVNLDSGLAEMDTYGQRLRKPQ